MTKIEWTEATWDPIVGCSIVSPGCTNCYAMKMANRLASNPATPQYHGTVQQSRGGPVWTGKVSLAEQVLLQPLKRKKPTMYFVNSMGDLFHEDVPDDWIDRVFAVMALCPQHTFQCLTKRSARMREYLCEDRPRKVSEWPLPNVWLGVSAEDQERARDRIPDLLNTPAAVRFVSAEPLLGPLYLSLIGTGAGDYPAQRAVGDTVNALTGERVVGTAKGYNFDGPHWPSLDWVICGGESGPGARPMHPDWARSLRDQCKAADTSFFFKQWGDWVPGENILAGVQGQRPHAHWFADKWSYGTTDMDDPEDGWMAPPDLYRIGKRFSGRWLDGVEWNEVPL